MIKALVFDVDGVLVHAEMFSKQLEKDYGIPMSSLQPFFADTFQRCLVGEVDLKESLKPHLGEWGWQGTVDEFINYWFSVEHQVDEPLLSYIAKVKSQGVACYVATNQEKYRAAYLLERLNANSVFDGFFASAHLGHKKPASEFFATMYNNLSHFDRSEILFWDDKDVNVTTAKEFGINAEIYTTFDNFLQKIANYKLAVER